MHLGVHLYGSSRGRDAHRGYAGLRGNGFKFDFSRDDHGRDLAGDADWKFVSGKQLHDGERSSLHSRRIMHDFKRDDF